MGAEAGWGRRHERRRWEVRRRWHKAHDTQRRGDGGDGVGHLRCAEAGAREEAGCLDLERVGSGTGGGREGGADGGGERVGAGADGSGWRRRGIGLGGLEQLADVPADFSEADGNAVGCEVGVGGDDGRVMGGDGIDGGGERGEEGRYGEAGRGKDDAVGRVGGGLDGGERDRERPGNVTVGHPRNEGGGMRACRRDYSKDDAEGRVSHRAARAARDAEELVLVDDGGIGGDERGHAGLDGHGRRRAGHARPRDPLACDQAHSLIDVDDLRCSDSDGDVEGVKWGTDGGREGDRGARWRAADGHRRRA